MRPAYYSIMSRADPDETLNGVAYRDLYLVRVQAGLEMVEMDQQGTLTLNRHGSNRADEMNTFHFTLNAVVANHAMGKQFDDASVAIIAPMLDTIEAGNIPNGFLPADTYFEADNERQMHLPNALVIVPDGMDVPDGFDNFVVRYSPGQTPTEQRENRNRAVADVFESRGVPFFTVTDDNWPGHKSFEDLKKLAENLAPGRDVHIGRAMSGPSHGWRSITGQMRGMLEDYRNGSRLYLDENGAEHPLLEHIEQTMPQRMREFIESENDKNADPKALAFYTWQEEAMLKDLSDVMRIAEMEREAQELEDKSLAGKHFAQVIKPPPLPATSQSAIAPQNPLTLKI